MLEFDWDDENLRHIARHGVTAAEVEYVLAHLTVDLGFQDWHESEERFSDAGATVSGRILVVVTTERSFKTRVVTAYDAPNEVREQYLKLMVS